MLVDIPRLAEQFNMQAEPDKLDIKRCEPGNLIISVPCLIESSNKRI